MTRFTRWQPVAGLETQVNAVVAEQPVPHAFQPGDVNGLETDLALAAYRFSDPEA